MDQNHSASEGEQPGAPKGAQAGPARAVELVAGDFLLTVNPVDGSEIESCPPGRRPITPRRAPASASEAGSGQDDETPLLERDEIRHRLGRLLAHGRSVRIAGAPGTGRTALLDAVARDCAGLAPLGVIRLDGYRRSPKDLLHELYAAAHHIPAYRPGPTELAAALREIGAVVIIDDIEFGGAGLDEILDATPECALLVAGLPGLPAATGAARVEELLLPGLSRTAALELLEFRIGRPLDQAETDWAADLWFDTEGLPQRFVQAAAAFHRRGGPEVPLPDSVTLTVTLAAALSEAAREVLRLATALGGDMPEAARLPSLTGEPQAAEAYTELLESGLLTGLGGRHRLASGVVADLLAAGYGEGSADRTLSAAWRYTWWLSEASVTPAAVAAEAEVLLAVLRAAHRAGHVTAVATLARAAAPMLAGTPRWGMWERVLRGGQEAARTAGEVAQEAYFHHELGVLAICEGRLDRARAELEAAAALRAAVADAAGAVAGRRALALVADLTGPRALPPGGTARTQPLALPAGALATPAGAAPGPVPGSDDLTQVILRPPTGADEDEPEAAPGMRRGAVAAAGGLLLAVLGTVVALGLSSGQDNAPENVQHRDPAVTDPDVPLTEHTGTPSASPANRSPKPSDSPSGTETPAESATSRDPYVPTDPDPTTPDPTGEEDGAAGGQGSGGASNGDGDSDPTGTPTEPEEPTDPPTETEEPTDPPTDPPTPTEEPTNPPTDPPTEQVTGVIGAPPVTPTPGGARASVL
ncbi:ATP-binding protein [Streptomyces sp. NBC_01803]|uniref:ATP-binding protein n=1 Tax=Streptomyces sp. NBC_01803 TaxID=2975946 RepID=UPI002DD9CD6A|nr:ATP-binding protein [Streptomyces sp. NBC_01803]WSA44152.1 ATP-binding protein [Streptomyces sp. NBC_01803]